jgi:hypothetical protein
MLDHYLLLLRAALKRCFEQQSPAIRATWPLSGRTVSEIGGRLVESYVLARLPHELSLAQFDGKIFCEIPESGRAMEDISVTFSSKSFGEVRLLVDIKGHNEYRSGSRPNLASIRKCIELYGDPTRTNDELVIFFCRYLPSVHPDNYAEEVKYQVLQDSFSEEGTFLLRSLSELNLDPANIGSGGQLLLAREDRIAIVKRSRAEFIQLLEALKARLQEGRRRF